MPCSFQRSQRAVLNLAKGEGRLLGLSFRNAGRVSLRSVRLLPWWFRCCCRNRRSFLLIDTRLECRKRSSMSGIWCRDSLIQADLRKRVTIDQGWLRNSKTELEGSC